MSIEDYQIRVRAIISGVLGVDEERADPGAHFVDDLGADSLDYVELVMGLEEEFKTQISDEEADKLKTVGDVNALIARKRGRKPAEALNVPELE